MKVLRKFWFMPRLDCETLSDCYWHDMDRQCKYHDACKAIQTLSEKTDEELGRMVRDWINNLDVKAYPLDFSELVEESIDD